MLDEGMRSPQTDCFIDVDANLRRRGNISTAAEPNLLRPHAVQRYISIHLGLNGIVWAEMLSQEIWMIAMRSPGCMYNIHCIEVYRFNVTYVGCSQIRSRLRVGA